MYIVYTYITDSTKYYGEYDYNCTKCSSTSLLAANTQNLQVLLKGMQGQ